MRSAPSIKQLCSSLVAFVLAGCPSTPHEPPTAPPPATTSPQEPTAIRLGAALPTHVGAIVALAVDDQRIVAATERPLEIEGRRLGPDDPGIHVWRHDATLRTSFGDRYVVAIATLPDDRVVTGDTDGRVRVWSGDGAPTDLGGGAVAVALGWHASSGRVVIVRADGSVALASPDGKGAPTALALGKAITAAAIGRDVVVAGARDGSTVRLALGGTPGSAAPLLGAGEHAITAIAIAPNDAAVVVGDERGEVRRVALAGGAEPAALRSRDGWPVRALAMLGSGHVVVSSPTQGQYLTVVAPDGARSFIDASDGPYDALVVHGDRVYGGSSEGIVHAFDPIAAAEVLAGPRHVAVPRAMAFDATGATLVVFARPEPMRWELATREATALPRVERWPDAIAPGGARALVVDGEAQGWAWHDVGTDRVGSWHPPARLEASVAFAGDVVGLAWVSGMDGEPAEIELLRGDSTIARWRADEHLGVRGLAGADDASRWATLDGEDRLHVWSGVGAAICKAAKPRLNAEIVFGRDANEVVLASQSDGLEIVETTGCTTVARLFDGDGGQPQGTTDAAWSLASAPRHGLFASGHASGTVRLWSLADRRELWVRRDHAKLVERLVFDGAGRQLASAAQDGAIVVHRW